MAGTKGRSGGNHNPVSVAGSMQPTEPPKKPAELSESAGRHWDDLVTMIPANVLVPIDGFELSILATLLSQSEFLATKLKDDPGDATTNRLYLQTFKEIHRLSSCFGLNPADRKRLNLKPESEYDAENDAIAQFFKELGANSN